MKYRYWIYTRYNQALGIQTYVIKALPPIRRTPRLPVPSYDYDHLEGPYTKEQVEKIKKDKEPMRRWIGDNDET